MHSTCFTSCNRCTNWLAIRSLNRLKHRSQVPARSPLVPQTGEFWGSGWLVCCTLLRMHACASFRFNRSSRTFVDFANFTRKCRTSRKTLPSRRLINLEQAERRTLAYNRLTPGCSTFRKTLGTSLVTVDLTVITLDRPKSSISTQWSAQLSIYAVTHRLNRNFAEVVNSVYCFWREWFYCWFHLVS